MKSIDYKNVKIKEGFIGRLQQLNADVSVYNVYKRFEETGRFRALLHIRDDAHKAHVFWDSDVAKWLESAAYILAALVPSDLPALAFAALCGVFAYCIIPRGGKQSLPCRIWQDAQSGGLIFVVFPWGDH